MANIVMSSIMYENQCSYLRCPYLFLKPGHLSSSSTLVYNYNAGVWNNKYNNFLTNAIFLTLR